MPVVNLTAQFIRGIKPPKTSRVEYWDATTPGLCLRITSNGRGSWSYRYRPREDGKQNERITFGSWDELSLADARDRAARVRAEVVDGGNPQLTRRQRREAARNALTLDRLAERYLEEYARPNKASWKDDEQRLVRVREELGHRDAAALTRRDFIDFLDRVKRNAPVQANRTQTIISGVYNWAVENELLDANPVSGLRKRARETASTRTLSDAEIRVLWRALETTTLCSRDVADALRLMLLVGQRPGEVAGMQQREIIDLERWEIPAERMKARRPHVVPLAPMARRIIADAIQRRRDEGSKGGVFASRFLDREAIARHSLSQALRRIIDQLGPDDDDAVQSLRAAPPTPHDFRRTVATGMAALGIPREDRLAVLAHLPGDIHGAVYDKYERLREKLRALKRWEQRVAAVIGAETSGGNVVALRAER